MKPMRRLTVTALLAASLATFGAAFAQTKPKPNPPKEASGSPAP